MSDMGRVKITGQLRLEVGTVTAKCLVAQNNNKMCSLHSHIPASLDVVAFKLRHSGTGLKLQSDELCLESLSSVSSTTAHPVG